MDYIYDFLYRFFLGSVSESLLSQAPFPVAIIKQAHETPAAIQTCRNIVLAVDDSPSSNEAFQWMAENALWKKKRAELQEQASSTQNEAVPTAIRRKLRSSKARREHENMKKKENQNLTEAGSDSVVWKEDEVFIIHVDTEHKPPPKVWCYWQIPWHLVVRKRYKLEYLEYAILSVKMYVCSQLRGNQASTPKQGR